MLVKRHEKTAFNYSIEACCFLLKPFRCSKLISRLPKASSQSPWNNNNKVCGHWLWLSFLSPSPNPQTIGVKWEPNPRCRIGFWKYDYTWVGRQISMTFVAMFVLTRHNYELQYVCMYVCKYNQYACYNNTQIRRHTYKIQTNTDTYVYV